MPASSTRTPRRASGDTAKPSPGISIEDSPEPLCPSFCRNACFATISASTLRESPFFLPFSPGKPTHIWSSPRGRISSELRGKVVYLLSINGEIVHETATRTVEEKLFQIILIPQLLRPSLGKARETLSQHKNLFVHRVGHDAHVCKPFTGLPRPLPTKLPSPLFRRRRKVGQFQTHTNNIP